MRARFGIGSAIARALALFFGVFSLANAVAAFRGSALTQDVWWVDLSVFPRWLAAVLAVACALALVWWGLRPRAGAPRRTLTSLAFAFLAGVACANVFAFYAAWRAGAIRPGVLFPLSAVLALAFAWLAIASGRPPADAPEQGANGANAVLVAVAFAALLVVFPVLQILFFGTTDYRRAADVAVVLGAKAFPNGVLSTSLEDRVRTAADLARSGTVPRLIMSGGTSDTGADEARMMAQRAVRLGVAVAAIDIDDQGVNTDATVANTVGMFEKTGVRRALVVSQFYHLARIKMAYRTAGWDVQTVPATESNPIVQTPLYVVREIPAFWLYWARSVFSG